MTEYTQFGYAADALAEFVRWRKLFRSAADRAPRSLGDAVYRLLVVIRFGQRQECERA
jgi:hypothetical protein